MLREPEKSTQQTHPFSKCRKTQDHLMKIISSQCWDNPDLNTDAASVMLRHHTHVEYEMTTAPNHQPHQMVFKGVVSIFKKLTTNFPSGLLRTNSFFSEMPVQTTNEI